MAANQNVIAINQMFAEIYALPGMDREQRRIYGSMHNALIANASQLVIPAKILDQAKIVGAVNFPTIAQAAILLLEGLLPTTGIWAEMLPILELLFAGLFPVPVTP